MRAGIASGAAGYDGLFGHVTRSFLPALLAAAQIAPGHRVLDVATGTGAAAEAVARLVGPSGQVIAGDISAAMLDIAERNLRDMPIRMEQFDGHALHIRIDTSTGSFVNWDWPSSTIRPEGSPNSTVFWRRPDEPLFPSTPRPSVLCSRGSARSSPSTYRARPSGSIAMHRSAPRSD
jgi:SAM-dependent methyltransferase